MKNYISLFLLLLFPFTALALGPTEKITVRVVEVVDGDTIKVDMSGSIDTVRILGIDTPEKYTSRTGYIECYWEEASKYALNLLSGKDIILEGDPKQKGRDIYNRLLAHVWIDGQLYGEKIIQDWYSFRYTKKTTKYQKVLVNAEKKAKKEKIGVWGVCGGKRTPVVLSNTGANTIQGGANQGSHIKSLPITSSLPNIQNIPSSGSGIYSCSSVPRYCSGVKTRDEAQYYLNTCGATKFDRDNDGIACEDIK
jgi:micrococcal nuclease